MVILYPTPPFPNSLNKPKSPFLSAYLFKSPSHLKSPSNLRRFTTVTHFIIGFLLPQFFLRRGQLWLFPAIPKENSKLLATGKGRPPPPGSATASKTEPKFCWSVLLPFVTAQKEAATATANTTVFVTITSGITKE